MPRWITKSFEVLIIPLIVGLAAAALPFLAAGPRVAVFYTFDEGYSSLPSRSRHLLLSLNALRDLAHNQQGSVTIPAKQLDDLRRQIQVGPPLIDGRTNVEMFDNAVKLFSEVSDSAQGLYYSEVVRFTVTNSGNRPAKDITLAPSSPGHFEVWTQGSPVDPEAQGFTRTTVIIASLQPGETKTVIYWPNNFLSESYEPLTATHSEGTASVQPHAEYRNGRNYVVSIPWLYLIAAATVIEAFFLVFIFRRLFHNANEA